MQSLSSPNVFTTVSCFSLLWPPSFYYRKWHGKRKKAAFVQTGHEISGKGKLDCAWSCVRQRFTRVRFLNAHLEKQYATVARQVLTLLKIKIHFFQHTGLCNSLFKMAKLTWMLKLNKVRISILLLKLLLFWLMFSLVFNLSWIASGISNTGL